MSSRRHWLGASAVWALAPQLHAHSLPAANPAAPALVNEADAQAQLDQARRVMAALARWGEPLQPTAVAAVEKLAAAGSLHAAAQAALRLLQARVLVLVSISPEARVGAQRSQLQASLVQSGWRLYLVRVDNPFRVPGRLGVRSPQSLPVHGTQATTGMAPPLKVPTARGDLAQRWLEMDLLDDATLGTELEPLATDFKVLRLYARDAGRRSARLQFDIGPGTGDLGGRDAATLHFTAQPARSVRLRVQDFDGGPVTCSWLVTDTQGRVLPAQSRRTVPDLFFQQKVYRADGQSLQLPPGDYRVTTGRGPEYLLSTLTRTVAAEGSSEWTVRLQRWVDPGASGWYSGDHHIHASGCAHYTEPDEGVGPEVLMPQIQGEALAIAGVLTWGPGYYTQKARFSGHEDPASTPQHRLRYDLEVSGFPSSHGGHLALLQMKAIEYPGTTRIEQWPSSNATVLRWARAQGALAGYAHAGAGLWAGSTELPNHRMPPFDGIGANDFIVTLPEGLVDFISTCNHPPAAEMTIWYHTLNVGLRARIAGETDWPCFYEESLGMGRSYVKVDGPLRYDAWCDGLRAGRSYVSEGRCHLMDLRASSGGQQVALGGPDLQLPGPAPVSLQVNWAARLAPEITPETEALRALAPLDKPYWHIERARVGATRTVVVELVVNGLAVEARAVPADGEPRQLQFQFTPSSSCWVALRVMGAAHTNPIWITVADAPIRVRRSAAWCREAVDVCWAQKSPRIRPAERAEEALLYERARQFYARRLAESAP